MRKGALGEGALRKGALGKVEKGALGANGLNYKSIW